MASMASARSSNCWPSSSSSSSSPFFSSGSARRYCCTARLAARCDPRRADHPAIVHVAAGGGNDGLWSDFPQKVDGPVVGGRLQAVEQPGFRREQGTRADREDQFRLLGAGLDPVGQHGAVHLAPGALTGVRSGCFPQAPRSNPPAGATPAAFLRGESLLPFLLACNLNSRSRRRGSRGVHLGKIGLTRSTQLCPES